MTEKNVDSRPERKRLAGAADIEAAARACQCSGVLLRIFARTTWAKGST